ncbi:serine aminopeptidase domain-containing protein, partial [Clostridioides difficile]
MKDEIQKKADEYNVPVACISKTAYGRLDGVKALEEAPKAVIQIAHGMAETAQRYETFAKVLTKNGYIVYINDHRGHGK